MSGWLRDLHEKMVRDPLPPERVAGGWALGMFIGCFIPFGLQLIVSVPLSFLMRVSKVGATVGTLITNPVSIFFIYPAQCWVGSRLVGAPLSWQRLSDEVFPVLRSATVFSAEGLRAIADLGWSVLGGFFAGGLLLGAILAPVTYFLVRRLVVEHRRRHGLRIKTTN